MIRETLILVRDFLVISAFAAVVLGCAILYIAATNGIIR